MGEIAEMMLTGILCAYCGEALLCDECKEMEIPAYCSSFCAKAQSAPKELICNHNKE